MLAQLEKAGITLNEDKCEFEVTKTKFIGHIIDHMLTTMLCEDSSSYGLGAAILQNVHGEWKPVAYASRVLTSAEQRYAQIEKEALAIAWACDKFNYYLAGRSFVVETNHKLLLAVLGSKELSKLPIRVQRFRLKMMAYTYSIVYTPDKHLVLADALSKSPVEEKVVTSGDIRDSNIVLENVIGSSYSYR